MQLPMSFCIVWENDPQVKGMAEYVSKEPPYVTDIWRERATFKTAMDALDFMEQLDIPYCKPGKLAAQIKRYESLANPPTKISV